MSQIGGYTSRSFSETQKFLVLDPSTGTTSLVLGADLVKYITPQLNYVRSETTRLAAEKENYAVGIFVQTAGAESIGDGLASIYLVVEGGEGDFPMLNGNSLLVIQGDDALRGQLASSSPGEGASLVSRENGDTLEEDAQTQDTAINNRVIRVGSVAEGFYQREGADKYQYLAAGWRDGSKVGGGQFEYRTAVSVDDHDGIYTISPSVPPVSAQAGATLKDRIDNYRSGSGEENPGGTGAFVKCKDVLNQVWIEEGGGVNDEDVTQAVADLKAMLSGLGGGVITGLGRYYVEGQIEIDEDDSFIIGGGQEITVFERTDTATSGFMFQWAANNNTEGGGLARCTLKGVRNPDTGNGGVAFGTNVNFANRWVSFDVNCDSWGQYGYAIYNGNDWKCSGIRVENHGHTETAISSCIGFNVYPKIESSDGVLHDAWSEIAADSIANSAAMKIQTHRNLGATKLFARGGTELCFELDSITGTVDGVTARAVTSDAGVIVRAAKTAHSFIGEWSLRNVDCRDSGFKVSFAIGGQSSGATDPSLKNCTIESVRCEDFRCFDRSSWQDSSFIDIDCSGVFRIDHGAASVLPPELPITGNYFRDVRAKVSFDAPDTDSEFINCGNTGGVNFYLSGDNNRGHGNYSHDAGSNGIRLAGSGNILLFTGSINAAASTLRFESGADNNVVQGYSVGNSTVTDNGAGNDVTQFTAI